MTTSQSASIGGSIVREETFRKGVHRVIIQITQDAAGNFTNAGGILPGYTDNMTRVRAVPTSTVAIVSQSAYKDGKTATLNNFAALVAPFDAPAIPWWQSIGGTAPITQSTVAVAGLS